MVRRDIQDELFECSREYPVLCITGPRQSGKTTWSRKAFPKHRYVSFEDPIARGYFIEDPHGFLDAHRDGEGSDNAKGSIPLQHRCPSTVSSELAENTLRDGWVIQIPNHAMAVLCVVSHTIIVLDGGRNREILLIQREQ